MKEIANAIVLFSTMTRVLVVCKCRNDINCNITENPTITTGLLQLTPSPNITTLQSAVFKCTVDVVVPVTWTVNETSSADTMFFSSYGIIADGLGTQDSTLTIPGNPSLNGTVVQCRALGYINNELYYEADSDTLYIQGM